MGRSWEFFSSDIYHYHKAKGSCSGYDGKSYSPTLNIDIDDYDNDMSQLKHNLRTIANYIDLETIKVYFSGRKGFHIEIPSSYFGVKPSTQLPQRMKKVVTQLELYNDQALYKTNQLYRMNNSIHQTTNLYKTEIDSSLIINEEISFEEIKACSGNKEPLNKLGEG